MKYYLCIDKGQFEKTNKRYLRIPLDKLNLNINNNLKRLCTFTMTFENDLELKKFLFTKKLIPKQYIYYDLVITYETSRIHTMLIPYKSEEPLFNIYNLTQVIVKEFQNGEFMNLFLDAIDFDLYKPEEYYELKEICTNPYSMYVLHDKVLSFLSKYLYQINYNQKYLNYKKLCGIVLLVKRLRKKPIVNNQVSQTKRKKFILDESQNFKLNECKEESENLEGQLNLFKM